MRRLLTCLPLVLLLSSCDLLQPELRIHTPDQRHFEASKVAEIFDEQSSLHLTTAEVTNEVTAVEALTGDLADLALVENSVAFVSGLRAVLPIFESVLHIAFHEGYNPGNRNFPLQGASFHITNNSTAGGEFVGLVTRRQGLEESDYIIHHQLQPGKTDIIIYFGPINPDMVDWMPAGYELISLDNEFNPHSQFYKEGIGYIAPNMKPRVIPALTYELPGNEKALLTVSVDTLMVAHKRVPANQIYHLTRTLLEQKPRLAAVAPTMFNGVNESFDPLDLSFPLHEGARAYLERDEPGMLERYAETINMLVYVTFLLITSFLAFGRWRTHRKKDRMDTFYVRVMSIRDRRGSEEASLLLEELEALEREAFEWLIAEKLSADESFRIFTDLAARLRSDLTADVKAAAGQAKQAGAE